MHTVYLFIMGWAVTLPAVEQPDRCVAGPIITLMVYSWSLSFRIFTIHMRMPKVLWRSD